MSEVVLIETVPCEVDSETIILTTDASTVTVVNDSIEFNDETMITITTE